MTHTAKNILRWKGEFSRRVPKVSSKVTDGNQDYCTVLCQTHIYKHAVFWVRPIDEHICQLILKPPNICLTSWEETNSGKFQIITLTSWSLAFYAVHLCHLINISTIFSIPYAFDLFSENRLKEIVTLTLISESGSPDTPNTLSTW